MHGETVKLLHFALHYLLVKLWTTAKQLIIIFGDLTENRIAALLKYYALAIARKKKLTQLELEKSLKLMYVRLRVK